MDDIARQGQEAKPARNRKSGKAGTVSKLVTLLLRCVHVDPPEHVRRGLKATSGDVRVAVRWWVSEYMALLYGWNAACYCWHIRYKAAGGTAEEALLNLEAEIDEQEKNGIQAKSDDEAAGQAPGGCARPGV